MPRWRFHRACAILESIFTRASCSIGLKSTLCRTVYLSMRPPAEADSHASSAPPSGRTRSTVSEHCIPAYVPGTAADLRWVDGSKEKGLNFDAMDPMYVVEPGVRYTYRLSEAALASVENSTLPEDVKVYFRHDIVINAQNEGRRACLIGWDLAKADLGSFCRLPPIQPTIVLRYCT